MRIIRQVIILAVLGVAATALASESHQADEQLNNVLADYWDFYLAADPIEIRENRI